MIASHYVGSLPNLELSKLISLLRNQKILSSLVLADFLGIGISKELCRVGLKALLKRDRGLAEEVESQLIAHDLRLV